MIYPFVFILGLIFGSFLNVLADRLSKRKTILGRSKCDSCNHELAWNDLIPIVSYMMLGGKCRYCKASFSIQYPLVELFTAGVFVMTWYVSTEQLLLPRSSVLIHIFHMAIAAVLIVMLLADLRYQIIPDEMQIALLLIGFLKIMYVGVVFGQSDILQLMQMVGQHIILGVAVMAPLLAVFLLTKGRGMGFGDVKLTFVIGVILGMVSGYLALYIGFVSGGIIGALLLVTKRGKRKTKIAFGPFLILGFYVMLFFEPEIILFMSRIYGF
ncbi:MAG: Type 4 prepilin-like protein leader peptide-processing enzyme PilD [Candidatus Roizmanbacteria bacterium GW2011_GWA2_37_7]|uniref:Type 4 prepilin-like protein leader peptide-processing enzyme PilD n=1 Tax=Candidatus Roizmanbacteria bacterium GW2011_GWA2_37_7 TaxID=1618481 RepID=A0A0G0JLT9_9BACT|nr:MAG: Type 4 prepilin-like protein leader peptide-processing enzyme PilD [Candidatus Roizmanbacteria bacterium GW2011_GWA2_37_7]